MNKLILTALIATTLGACAGSPIATLSKSPEKMRQASNAELCAAYSFAGSNSKKIPLIKQILDERAEDVRYRIVDRKVIKVGLTRCELLMSWGYPTEINRSSHGPEQWVYRNVGVSWYRAKYVYVEGVWPGRVVAWN